MYVHLKEMTHFTSGLKRIIYFTAIIEIFRRIMVF